MRGHLQGLRVLRATGHKCAITAVGRGHRVGLVGQDGQVGGSVGCRAHRPRIRRALHVLVFVEPQNDLSAKTGGADEYGHHQSDDEDVAA